MKREILWNTLAGNSSDAAFAAESMAHLRNYLRQLLPGLRLGIRELSGELLDSVAENLTAGCLDRAVAAVQRSWPNNASNVLAHVTVYCPDAQCPAVLAARRRLPHARWGISFSGALSLTYARDNPCALWHESLHLLGAQDHYDPTTFRTTCGFATCLMQYAPVADAKGLQPSICPATREIISRACA